MTPEFEAVETVGAVFDRAMSRRPDAEALVTRTQRWSYVELDEACARAAGALLEMGVRPGDRVAACFPNEADIVVAFHGAMRIGAVWVGINQALAPPERQFLIDDAGAGLLLDETNFSLTSLDGVTPRRDLAPIDPDAPAGLAYTSGTTGRPKGAIHTQRNLLLPGRVLRETRGWDHRLRKGDCLPLTILNMMALTTLLVAQAEGTCVVMDQRHAEGVAEWIERERVTVWNGPPALLHSLITTSEVDRGALATLDEVWSGGSDLPESLRARFDERFGTPLVATYGLSEAPTVVSIDPVGGDHVEGASGRVLPHLTVTVDDAVDDAVEGAVDGRDGNHIGELCLSPATAGPYDGDYTPPLGYWNRPEASEELLAGGVVHTGDIGFVDGDGWLHVRDRKNLVIIRGGANVYPAEVERVLLAVDGVAGAVVTGIDDERLGQRVVAAVEPDAGGRVDATAIEARCHRELARYKVPERVEVVDALPRNAMGKIDRTAVGQLFDPPERA